MYIYNIYIYIYIYTYTYTYIYTCTCTHTYNQTHTNRHIYTYVKLFVIRFESPHPDPTDLATSQLKLNERQITDFHKTRNTRAGNPRTESVKESIKRD